MKVVVLHDGLSADASRDQQDVLIQAGSVSKALAGQGHEPVILSVSADLSRLIGQLDAIRPDFVFNLVESVIGDGRLIHLAPSILDHLKIPYTGARTEAIFATSHKLMAKRFMQANGLHTPLWIANGEACLDSFIPDCYIIKSVWEHASVGLDEHSMVSVRDLKRVYEEMASRRASLGGDCFAERFIAGREFNLSLLTDRKRPEVLPPAEICFEGYPSDKPHIVCYRAKWVDDSFEYSHTTRTFQFPPEDSFLLRKLTDLAIDCWRLFDLKGYARVDFRVDQDGRPWVLEINANPCLSPDGGFYAAAEQAGLSFNQVIERIITDL